ncbi:MAG TPA: hypothetical protein PKG52_05520 [bacterium]|nr:hypothetical protein [bacterium]HPS29728.1 hypothetical protein [bacterium]
MKNVLFVILTIIISSCADITLPDLPDGSMTVEDAMVLDFDIAENSDDEGLESELIVATVGGYDVPFSGHVYRSNNEEIQALDAIIPDFGMGSAAGSDIALGTWSGGFFVIGRYDSSSVYFFTENGGENNFEFNEVNVGTDKVLNLQDGVYNHLKDEFIISALNSNSLIILKNGEVSELKISENENASPVKMKVIGDRLFVAMQNLNDIWKSETGQIAVIDLNDYNIQIIDLPVKNPVGKIEYNQVVDAGNFYISCAGSWQKRDGALLRVDINSFKTQIIVKESSEEGNLLNGDMVDISIADNGDFYLVFSSNSDRWTNKLLRYETSLGRISEISSGVNAFAANPVEYSSVTKKIYYFADIGADTCLMSIDSVSGKSEKLELDEGPAAVKVRLSENDI